MNKIANKLRIGEKIGFGFGLVGLLFLVVIGQYHNTLTNSLSDYQHLNDVYGSQKDQAMAIEESLLNARQAEKDFLLKRNITDAKMVAQHIQTSLDISSQLQQSNEIGEPTSAQFNAHLEKYLDHFQMLEAAWQKKGLDENSGLQGSFREAVHALEELAAHLKTDKLYLNLLQIRRAEKDLGLRREAQYKARALKLIDDFKQTVSGSKLQQTLKDKLHNEIEVYQEALLAYSTMALSKLDINGGTGPFRQSAHRLESLINQHYITDLERNILQLRRHEKDYLLRDEQKYIQLALKQIQTIKQQVEVSQVDAIVKGQFLSLLNNYQRDFLALVEQNKHIEKLNIAMENAASNVTGLVNNKVSSSNSALQSMTQNINNSTDESSNLMLWIVAIACILGIYFAINITLSIVKPLRKMAILLEKLTYTELIKKMPFQAGGRDEVNAMAGSLNTLADHRRRFISWWQNSMNEAESCEQLQGMLEQLSNQEAEEIIPEFEKIKVELKEALSIKKSLLSDEYQQIRACNDDILEKSAMLNHVSVSRGDIDEGANAIRYSAEIIHKTLDNLSYGAR